MGDRQAEQPFGTLQHAGSSRGRRATLAGRIGGREPTAAMLARDPATEVRNADFQGPAADRAALLEKGLVSLQSKYLQLDRPWRRTRGCPARFHLKPAPLCRGNATGMTVTARKGRMSYTCLYGRVSQSVRRKTQNLGRAQPPAPLRRHRLKRGGVGSQGTPNRP